MRHSKKILTILCVIFLIIAFTPFICGLIYQRLQKNVITFVNSQGDIKVKLIKFQSGWFHSKGTLQVQLVNPDFLKVLNVNGTQEIKPLTFIVKQYIQHGPFIWNQFFNPAAFFNLAAIYNYYSFYHDVDYVSYTGNYRKKFLIPSFEISFLPKDLVLAIKEGIAGNIWLKMNGKRIATDIDINKLELKSDEDILQIPFFNLKFDQTLSPSGIWVGSSSVKLPQLLVTDNNDDGFNLINLKEEGYSNDNAGSLEGYRDLKFEKLILNHSAVGPVKFKISFKGLNIEKINELVDSYRKVLHEGQLYRNQLSEKIMRTLPLIVNENSSVILDILEVVTPKGVFTINGTINWQNNNFTQPENLLELFQASNVVVNLRINKRLLSDLTHLLVGLPYFGSINQEVKDRHSELHTEMQIAKQRNLYFINGLLDEKKLNEATAIELLTMQRESWDYTMYLSAVKKLYFNHTFSNETEHLLLWHYANVRQNEEALNALLINTRKTQQAEMQQQFEWWLKQKYISEDQDNYLITIKWLKGNLRINDKALL